MTIETRDLDTDERSRTVEGAICPSEPYAQRAQLAALVARRHPNARFRSFSDGTASFLDAQHLIVASYESGTRPARRRDAPAGVEQPVLFSA